MLLFYTKAEYKVGNVVHNKSKREDSMKTYVMNWNGRVERMVAAKSKKAARELLSVSEYSSRDVLHETGNKHDIEVAMGKQGLVFEKPYSPSNSEWILLEVKPISPTV